MDKNVLIGYTKTLYREYFDSNYESFVLKPDAIGHSPDINKRMSRMVELSADAIIRAVFDALDQDNPD